MAEMGEAGNYTEQVAAYVAGLRYTAIPEATKETAKRLLLDGIGCMLAGTRGGPGRVAAEMVADMRGSGGPSTIVLTGERATARDAAFINGMTLYSVGVNDIHKPSGSHPGGCIIPALLAMAEWRKSRGTEMLAAMVAAYDIMGRLGRATIPSHRERGFHPTGTFGAFGATAATTRLLEMNQRETVHALGITGSQAAGLKAFQTDGSFTMIFHAARSAQNGIEAALLARAGLTGPRTVLEDKQGFIAATSDVYHLPALTAGLGRDFEVDATTFRPYYGCTLTITASGATAEIMKRHAKASSHDVVAISVRCNPVVIEEVGNADPQTLLSARLSIQFNVALVVVRGDVFVGDVTDEDLHDQNIRRLMPLIELVPDSDMPRYASVVTLGFRDGTNDRAEMFDPKGDPQTPMTWDDVESKFMKLVEPLAAAGLAERVVHGVRNLEKSDGESLMRAIAAVPRAGRI